MYLLFVRAIMNRPHKSKIKGLSVKIGVGVLIAVLLAYGFSYKGEGVLEKNGLWPLRSYILTLDEFNFAEGISKEYDIVGMKSNNYATARLNITSPTPILFHELSANVELKIYGEQDEVLLNLFGGINHHFLRMAEAKDVLPSAKSEWIMRFKKGTGASGGKVYPFDEKVLSPYNLNMQSVKASPIYGPTLSMDYTGFFSVESKMSKVSIQINSVPREFKDLTASIGIVSIGK